MITRALLNATAEFEGLRLKAYRCPAGVWTIGYGHTRSVTPDMTISASVARKWLEEDLRAAQRVVLNNTRGVHLTTSQLDALTSFVFNLGASHFRLSTLLRKVKAQAPPHEVAREFGKWVYAGGKILPGLVRRREWESQKYLENLS